ncbi:hypothetical protein [Shewanella polaris]|uniref:O-antigen ligase family protein n=1 Tax=Shewanella polaris TaxID=2588449 RepID=A0A4Y5YD37_9GAMM|nr:hypothetical protein [Shewanella polaris]QDE30508.1 hypothetical protein FH971_05660 [Shewanella polaris]
MKVNLRIKGIYFLVFLLSFNLFFPTFNNIFDENGGTGVLIINFVMFSFLFLHSIYSYFYKRLYFTQTELIAFFISLSFLVNILVTGINNHELIFSDVYELFRPVYYLFCFLYGFNLIRLNTMSVGDFVKYMSFGIFFTALFSLLCIVFINSFGLSVISLYAKYSLIPNLRFTGTFQNPYDFAFISALPLSYFLTRFILSGSKVCLIYISIILITMAFGQSKSGFITLLSVIILNLILYKFYESNSQKSKAVNLRLALFPIAFFTSCIFLYIIFADQFQYLINGLISMSSGGDRSSKIRLDQFFLLLNMINEDMFKFLVGFGSFKSSGLMFESQYSLYLFRYGVYGVFLLFCFILLPLVIFFFSKKITGLQKLIVLLFVFSAIPSGFGNNVLDQSRIPFLYFSFLGVIFSVVMQKNRHKEKM